MRGQAHAAQTLAIWLIAAGCQFDTSPLVQPDSCLAPAAGRDVAQCPGVASPQESMSAVNAFGNPPPVAPRNAGVAAATTDAAMAPSAAPAAGNNKPLEPSQQMDLDAGSDDVRDATPSAPDAAESFVDSATQQRVPGTSFSPCTSDSQCSGGLVCTANPIWSGSGFQAAGTGYCTSACRTNGTEIVCSQPASGEVVASCQLNGLCMLGSCAQAACPTSMSCVQTPIPTASGQVAYLSECSPLPNP